MEFTPYLEWHYARQAVPGYAELTNAHNAMNWAMASAELEHDSQAACDAVYAAWVRWNVAYGIWHPLAAPRMPE